MMLCRLAFMIGSLLGSLVFDVESTQEFDFLSNYEIVQTKITDSYRGRLHLSLETLNGLLVFAINLLEATNSSAISPNLKSFTVHNSSGVFTIPNEIVYYRGHVASNNTLSDVHGTLYKDLSFEGVIKLADKTFYLEAVNRHKRSERKDLSILYSEDDVAELTKNISTFPDIPSYTAHSDPHSEPVHFIRDMYGKFHGLNPRPSKTGRKRAKRLARAQYCNMHVVVDSYYVHYMGNDNKLETAKLLSQYVQNVHEIYLAHDFDGNGRSDNVGVVMAGLTFIDKIYGFNYLDDEKDPVEFLEAITNNYRFPDMCSAMVFTFQDFGPTLGMAWVGQTAQPKRSGVGGMKNHGFCTTLLKGRRIPLRVASLTLAHELGHSFGSSHDPKVDGNQCAPTDAQGGKYIMFPMTSKANMPNNFRFSPCSKNIIAMIMGTRTHVLKQYQAPYCGNGHIEASEECDCGTPLSCKELDHCCTPAGETNQCMLQRGQGAVCSPAVHDCCSPTCQILERQEEEPCGGDDECLQYAYCDGVHYICPTPQIKNNGTLCRGDTRFCELGMCSRSVCEVAGLLDCQCSEPNEACRLCCSDNQKCRPASEFDWFAAQNYSIAMWLEPGSLCMDNDGYCSEDRLCMKPGVDYVSVLGLSVVTKTVSRWFDGYWYVMMIMITLCLSLFAIFICSREDQQTGVTGAFRVGNVARVIQECHRQQRILNDQIDRLNKDVHMFERGQNSMNTALARLMLLFPLTPLPYLYRIMTNSANEYGAVKKLLLMKQPMREDVTKHRDLTSPMKEATMTIGKANEQFRGRLVATMKDMEKLTKAEREALGITDLTAAQRVKINTEQKQNKMTGVLNLFRKLKK